MEEKGRVIPPGYIEVKIGTTNEALAMGKDSDSGEEDFSDSDDEFYSRAEEIHKN